MKEQEALGSQIPPISRYSSLEELTVRLIAAFSAMHTNHFTELHKLPRPFHLRVAYCHSEARRSFPLEASSCVLKFLDEALDVVGRL